MNVLLIENSTCPAKEVESLEVYLPEVPQWNSCLPGPVLLIPDVLSLTLLLQDEFPRVPRSWVSGVRKEEAVQKTDAEKESCGHQIKLVLL